MTKGRNSRCTAFNGGFRRISGEALYREATGFWQRVEVTPVGAIGGNPQVKDNRALARGSRQIR